MSKYYKLLLLLILVLAAATLAGQEAFFSYSLKYPPYEALINKLSDKYRNEARDYIYEGNFNGMEACIDIQTMLNAFQDPILSGDIENQKGVIEYYKNNSSEALQYYLKALDYYNMSDYRGGINSIMNNIAIIFNHIEDYESSRKYLIKAIESTPENDINSRSIYLLNLAETESQLNNCTAGIMIANDLLDMYRPNELFFSELYIYGVLIACYNKMGMSDEADQWIQKGVATIDTNSTYFDKIAFYSQALRYHFEKGEYREVIELGRNIYPPLDTTFMRDMYEPINHMAIAAVNIGDMNLAVELDRVANRIVYSNEALAREDLITPLMVEYSFNRDIANRDMARIQLTENNKQARAQRNLLISLLIIMIAMIVLIPILVRIRKLRSSFKMELSDQNKKLEQINKQLKTDNEELVKGNHLLDTFISVFAHDLINPFQAIIGFSQLMSTDHEVLRKEDFIEYSELLSETSFHLNQLLTNLKSLSISQDDPEKLQPSRVLVGDIINNVLKLFESTARKKNIHFEILNTGKDCIGFTNPDVIESAVRNVISNSVKFSKPDSRIEIDCRQEENEVIISIKDYGSGIPEKVLRQLLAKEKSESRLGTANEKGSGIGLAISIELLESFNGSLELKSIIGQGTEAIIKIEAWNE